MYLYINIFIYKYIYINIFIYLKLLRKASRIFYSILDLKSITDNKTFRKAVKPFFLDKQVLSSKTTLITSNEIIHDVKKVLNIFNFFFQT